MFTPAQQRDEIAELNIECLPGSSVRYKKTKISVLESRPFGH